MIKYSVLYVPKDKEKANIAWTSPKFDGSVLVFEVNYGALTVDIANHSTQAFKDYFRKCTINLASDVKKHKEIKITDKILDGFLSDKELTFIRDFIDYVLCDSKHVELSSHSHKERFCAFEQLYTNTHFDYFQYRPIITHYSLCGGDNPMTKAEYEQGVLDEEFVTNKVHEIASMNIPVSEKLFKIMQINDLKNVVYKVNQVFCSFFEFIIWELKEMINNNTIIKVCANCGKYFIPYNRSDTLYCDEISPQDSTKTCKEYGAIKTYQHNLRTNEAMGLYRKIYMAKQMLAKRHPDLQRYADDFENYKVQSKQWKRDVKAGIKTESEYLEWLKSVKEKKVIPNA